jgi:DNA repair exonuclease SbcCD ATPase subunit
LKGLVVVTKFALPVLVLCLYGLIFYAFKPETNLAITSLSSNVSREAASTPAEATTKRIAGQKPAEPSPEVAQAESAGSPESQKAPAEPRAATPEPSPAGKLDSIGTELQRLTDDIKTNTEKIDQTAKLIQDLKSEGDKAAQSLRAEVTASQAKLADVLKANSASAETLAQRVDTMRKEIEQVKKKIDDGRKMPFVAFFTALVALFFGLFVAYRFKNRS